MAGVARALKQRKELAAQEKELIQAEGRQASPFGNPNATRKQRAEGGGGFSPAKGAVSEEARALAEDPARRKKAKKFLDQQVASQTAAIGKKRGSVLSSPSSSLLSSSGPKQSNKSKLGV